MKSYARISEFNPCVEVLNDKHRDLLCQFDSGSYAFDEFIKKEVYEFSEVGDGITYLVINCLTDDDGDTYQEIVAYYTLAAASQPIISRVCVEPIKKRFFKHINKKRYDEKLYGIPAIEVKMFAVSKKYQDKFFKFDNETMPIAAIVLRQMFLEICNLSNTIVAAKLVILKAVKNAEKFYKKNNFQYIEKNMVPFSSEDENLRSMYIKIPGKDFYICYDE